MGQVYLSMGSFTQKAYPYLAGHRLATCQSLLFRDAIPAHRRRTDPGRPDRAVADAGKGKGFELQSSGERGGLKEATAWWPWAIGHWNASSGDIEKSLGMLHARYSVQGTCIARNTRNIGESARDVEI